MCQVADGQRGPDSMRRPQGAAPAGVGNKKGGRDPRLPDLRPGSGVNISAFEGKRHRNLCFLDFKSRFI